MVIVFRRCNVSPGLHHLMKRGGSTDRKGSLDYSFSLHPSPFVATPILGLVVVFWTRGTRLRYSCGNMPDTRCVKNTLKKQNRFWNCMELCLVVQPTPPKQQSLVTQLWPPCSRHRNSFCYKWMFLSVITS